MKIDLIKEHHSFSGLSSFYSHESALTKTKMNFSVLFPNKIKEAKNCIIWLSGLTCNEENFITKAGAQAYIDQSDTLIICPDTSPRGLDLKDEHESWDFGSAASFYINATTNGYVDHYQMEDYIVNEIVDLVKENFNSLDFSIMGHSMGGHGALTLGLKYPKLFKTVSAFSPIVNPMNCPWGQKAFSGYLGQDQAEWAKHDATELIRNGARHQNKILIDQGSSDNFLEKELLTENIVKIAKEKSQPLEVNYREGFDHSYYFIASFIEGHIKLHQTNF
ncbi:MAG: S-formylglutathione hydrolase [Bdellovibrionales bacterium CG12_big_fil_rev_8_21_14_0_65_38_15]|nr:MAG: S-formylglutathione hydrolase [Bdellovibrionales bacterium CG22_combo_CG10-13_8_21_14_all_38_13]PIQ53422.1 MAG: S-formylglutathione hydrolase [Bdellovibrionales bacterium CG12_big_fil_rev_8_21_14_0_65_38_15]PIR30215.1 MAG: S-formylglutathione hydrolase [Bdellovibrionales bacterium CG11_big_fil_rev_8_21_14_0_20_38_13]